MKISILSDTHDLLRTEVLEHLEGSDHILHCGDFSRQEILDRLEVIAPVKAVRGNGDKEWAKHLPVSDMKSVIKTVVAETRKNRSVEDIARKHRLEPSLVEQVVRLYVTHPGVDEDGIMTKMGL